MEITKLDHNAHWLSIPRSVLGPATAFVELYLRNVEYSILLVMSELSTVRYDRALSLWIASTRASSVDGELLWRSSGRAAAVVSTPGSRAQAVTEGVTPPVFSTV